MDHQLQYQFQLQTVPRMLKNKLCRYVNELTLINRMEDETREYIDSVEVNVPMKTKDPVVMTLFASSFCNQSKERTLVLE